MTLPLGRTLAHPLARPPALRPSGLSWGGRSLAGLPGWLSETSEFGSQRASLFYSALRKLLSHNAVVFDFKSMDAGVPLENRVLLGVWRGLGWEGR